MNLDLHERLSPPCHQTSQWMVCGTLMQAILSNNLQMNCLSLSLLVYIPLLEDDDTRQKVSGIMPELGLY